jgi:hypothetical protein
MVKTYTAFDALPDDCVALLQESGRQNFFLGYDWFRLLAETTFEPEARLRIYVVDDASGTASLMLLARTPAGQNGSMLHCTPGPRSLASLTNYQSDIFAPIIGGHVTDRAALFDLVALHIASERPRWDVVDFNYLDSGTPEYQLLLAALRKAGFRAVSYFHCKYPYDDTEGLSFRDYLEGRAEQARKVIQNYAKKARRLERSRKVRYEVYRGADIERGLEDYQRVYAASWKASEPYPDFVPRFFRAAAAAGVLRLGVLYLDDEPAATEAAIVSGGRAVLVKTAFDEKYRDLSVGSIVMFQMMQHLLDVDRARQITRGAFDAPFKSLWLAQDRQLNGIAAFSPGTVRGWSACGQQLAWTAARAARNILKQRLPAAIPPTGRVPGTG